MANEKSSGIRGGGVRHFILRDSCSSCSKRQFNFNACSGVMQPSCLLAEKWTIH